MTKHSSESFDDSIKSDENLCSDWNPFTIRRSGLTSPSIKETTDPLARLQDYAFPSAQRNSALNTATGNDSWTGPSPAPWSSNCSPSEHSDTASTSVLFEPCIEPPFREQRSMSYSFGAYDWSTKSHFQQQQRSQHYSSINTSTGSLFSPIHNTSFLDTMREEESDEEQLIDSLRARVRSKSSAAVMDIWGPLKDTAFNRRLSLTPMPPPPILPTTPSLYISQASTNDRERIRRFSLAPLALETHSPFTLDGSSSSSNISSSTKKLMAQRRHSLAGPTQVSTMDTLTETIENLAVKTINGEKNEEGRLGIDEMGKGVKLDSEILDLAVFYVVEFKGGRSDIFYSSTPIYNESSFVIVEADRGLDLGKVNTTNIDRLQIELFYRNNCNSEEETSDKKQEIFVKQIFRQARPDEVSLLLSKGQDESKALVVCQSKIKQKKLSMQVLDSEYQWDRRKLTFYFVAEKRVDFRELVRELFKLYKTRIWMCTTNSIKTFEKIEDPI